MHDLSTSSQNMIDEIGESVRNKFNQLTSTLFQRGAPVERLASVPLEAITLVSAERLPSQHGCVSVHARYAGFQLPGQPEGPVDVYWEIVHYKTADKQSWWIAFPYSEPDVSPTLVTPLAPLRSLHADNLDDLCAHLKIADAIPRTHMVCEAISSHMHMTHAEMRMHVADKLVPSLHGAATDQSADDSPAPAARRRLRP